MIHPEKIEEHLDHYLAVLESELGDDLIPILMILVCRVAIKYNLNINWVVTTILIGYNNEVPPMIDDRPVNKYDS